MKKLYFPILVVFCFSFLFTSCNYNKDNPISSPGSINDGSGGDRYNYTLNMLIEQSAPGGLDTVLIGRTLMTNNIPTYNDWITFTTASWSNSTFTVYISLTFNNDNAYYHGGRYVIGIDNVDYLFDRFLGCGPGLSGTNNANYNLNLSSGTSYTTQLSTQIVTGGGDQ